MDIKFEIEQIFVIQARKEVYVLARQLGVKQDFRVTDDSYLDDVPIHKWMNIPRAHNSEGLLRDDLIAFVLRHPEDKDKLRVGQIVTLK